MSPETVAFLLSMLDQQTITVGHPDAEQISAQAFTARRELLTVLETPADIEP